MVSFTLVTERKWGKLIFVEIDVAVKQTKEQWRIN